MGKSERSYILFMEIILKVKVPELVEGYKKR
jgi:hypothetical protein